MPIVPLTLLDQVANNRRSLSLISRLLMACMIATMKKSVRSICKGLACMERDIDKINSRSLPTTLVARVYGVSAELTFLNGLVEAVGGDKRVAVADLVSVLVAFASLAGGGAEICLCACDSIP